MQQPQQQPADRVSSIKQALSADGALFNAVTSNPQTRGFYWVTEELEQSYGLRPTQMCGQTKLAESTWREPGNAHCPYGAQSCDALASGIKEAPRPQQQVPQQPQSIAVKQPPPVLDR